MSKKVEVASDLKLSDRETDSEEKEDDQLWAVIEITGERRDWYKVKWAGLDPSTKKPWAQSWVPKHDCTEDLVHEWRMKKAKKRWDSASPRKLSSISSRKSVSGSATSKKRLLSNTTRSTHSDSSMPTSSKRKAKEQVVDDPSEAEVNTARSSKRRKFSIDIENKHIRLSSETKQDIDEIDEYCPSLSPAAKQRLKEFDESLLSIGPSHSTVDPEQLTGDDITLPSDEALLSRVGSYHDTVPETEDGSANLQKMFKTPSRGSLMGRMKPKTPGRSTAKAWKNEPAVPESVAQYSEGELDELAPQQPSLDSANDKDISVTNGTVNGPAPIDDDTVTSDEEIERHFSDILEGYSIVTDDGMLLIPPPIRSEHKVMTRSALKSKVAGEFDVGQGAREREIKTEKLMLTSRRRKKTKEYLFPDEKEDEDSNFGPHREEGGVSEVESNHRSTSRMTSEMEESTEHDALVHDVIHHSLPREVPDLNGVHISNLPIDVLGTILRGREEEVHRLTSDLTAQTIKVSSLMQELQSLRLTHLEQEQKLVDRSVLQERDDSIEHLTSSLTAQALHESSLKNEIDSLLLVNSEQEQKIKEQLVLEGALQERDDNIQRLTNDLAIQTLQVASSTETLQGLRAINSEHEQVIMTLGNQLRDNQVNLSKARSDLNSAISAKELAEKDTEGFRDEYRKAFGLISVLRDEKAELENRIGIAERQTREAVALVKRTFETRVKELEVNVASWRRSAMFTLDVEAKTNGEVRRRAAEEPELRATVAKLHNQLREKTKECMGWEHKTAEMESRLEETDKWKDEIMCLKNELESVEIQDGEAVYRCPWREGSKCSRPFRNIQDLHMHMRYRGHISERTHLS